MNPHSLLASAAINIGLAFVTLSLFSLLKKQPSTASIYARPLSHHHQIPLHSPSTSLRRFLPCVGWVFRTFRVTDEILDAHGLNALVIIRLFKFGSVFSLRLFHMHFIFFYSLLFFSWCLVSVSSIYWTSQLLTYFSIWVLKLKSSKFH